MKNKKIRDVINEIWLWWNIKFDSLFSFFDWKNLEKNISVETIKEFFDYQMKYLWVDWLDWKLFYEDFKVLEENWWDKQEKLLKEKIFTCYQNVLLENLKAYKKFWIFPFTQNNNINSFFKRIFEWTWEWKDITINIWDKEYSLWKNSELKLELEKDFKNEIDNQKIKILNDLYKNQKKNFHEMTKLYNEVMWWQNGDEEDESKLRKKWRWKRWWMSELFQWNIFSYMSRFSFEFNVLFVPMSIEKQEKKDYWEVDYTDYWIDEEEQVDFIVRSNEQQMLIRYFLSMIDWLYWSKTIYLFATDKELEKMKTYSDYKKFQNRSTRKTKFSFIVSDKMYLLSNTYLYLIFDILQRLNYWDKEYHKYINEVKMILIEKTDISKLTLLELQVLLNWTFYRDFWSKLFTEWFKEYTKEDQIKITNILKKIAWQSSIWIDEEYEIDLYETKKNNTNTFIERNLEKFNKEMWLWKFINSLYNFFLIVLLFNEKCWSVLEEVKLKDVKSQINKINTKQSFFNSYLK